MSTFVSAQELRTRMVSRWTPKGCTDPEPVTDLRGSPIGERAEVWEWDRLVAPRGTGRRSRQHVKVMHCPEGWYSQGGTADSPAGPEICSTLLDPKWAAQGGDWHKNYHEFHEQHPVVWVIHVTRQGGRRTHQVWCDPELPDEFRPTLPHEDAPPVKPRAKRKETTEPSYFAHWDYWPSTGQASVSYWYRHISGQIRPWPPKRSHFGSLYRRDIPEGLDTAQEEQWRDRYWADVRNIRRNAVRDIEAEPEVYAALFAVLQSNCCRCGRTLTDSHSKAYGIGPECRQGMPAEKLRYLSSLTARAQAGADGIFAGDGETVSVAGAVVRTVLTTISQQTWATYRAAYAAAVRDAIRIVAASPDAEILVLPAETAFWLEWASAAEVVYSLDWCAGDADPSYPPNHPAGQAELDLAAAVCDQVDAVRIEELEAS